MLTRKECKWCGSIWHSKNKCEKRQINPFKPVYSKKGTNTLLSTKNASERLTLPYKGKSERSQLIGWADKLHSAYIRGLSAYCYTCGAKPEELQNGHFMARRYMNTRWIDMNCHPQCNDCNVVKRGNLKVYEERLRAEYGDEAIDDLKHLARSGGKVSLEYIQSVIDEHIGVVF